LTKTEKKKRNFPSSIALFSPSLYVDLATSSPFLYVDMQPKIKCKTIYCNECTGQDLLLQASLAHIYHLLQLHMNSCNYTVEECERKSALCSISSISISILATILQPLQLHAIGSVDSRFDPVVSPPHVHQMLQLCFDSCKNTPLKRTKRGLILQHLLHSCINDCNYMSYAATTYPVLQLHVKCCNYTFSAATTHPVLQLHIKCCNYKISAATTHSVLQLHIQCCNYTSTAATTHSVLQLHIKCCNYTLSAATH